MNKFRQASDQFSQVELSQVCLLTELKLDVQDQLLLFNFCRIDKSTDLGLIQERVHLKLDLNLELNKT